MPGPPSAAQKAAKDWYVSPGGNIWQATGAEADLLKFALGWQGPLTYAEAQTAASATPGPLANVNQKATNTIRDAGNTLTGLQDIGDFFHRLTETATWARVGEVLLGGILIYAGIRALTHGSSTVGAGARKSATKPVKRAVKTVATVAAPEVRLATRTASKKVAPKTTARVAAHRATVRKYGAKKPYVKPESRPSRTVVHKTIRESHIHHHKGPKTP